MLYAVYKSVHNVGLFIKFSCVQCTKISPLSPLHCLELYGLPTRKKSCLLISSGRLIRAKVTLKSVKIRPIWVGTKKIMDPPDSMYSCLHFLHNLAKFRHF